MGCIDVDMVDKSVSAEWWKELIRQLLAELLAEEPADKDIYNHINYSGQGGRLYESNSHCRSYSRRKNHSSQ